MEFEPTTNFEKYMIDGQPARVTIVYEKRKNELDISIPTSLQKLFRQNYRDPPIVREFYAASPSWSYEEKRSLESFRHSTLVISG